MIGVVERTDLVGQIDATLFSAMNVEGRVIVTENAADFIRLARAHAEAEHSHAGLIVVSPRRFPRRRSRLESLLSALGAMLRAHPGERELRDTVRWL